MAVQQNKKSPSKRGMHRSHNALAKPGIAIEPTTFAVLSRDAMVRIILEEPSLGAKLLIKLVTLLSQRLRQTSSTLLHYMER